MDRLVSLPLTLPSPSRGEGLDKFFEVLKGYYLKPQPFERSPEVPPDITFISLPKALAQFHHLPSHVPIWVHQQARVEEKGYDFQEGLEPMRELLKQTPSAPGAYLFQLFLKKWPKLVEVNPYFESNRIAEAIPKLVEILDIDPECPLTCFQLGFCFRATGELEKSASFYQQALRMAPEAGWIYSNMARTYQAMGDHAKASEAYWKALDLLPGDHFVLEQLMALGELFALPQEDQAGKSSASFVRRADYEKKMKEIVEKEKNPSNLFSLGWRLLQDRLNNLACECFESAHRLNPELSEAILGLGTAHLEAGRFKEAEIFLEEYLDLNPQSAAAHLNLFKVYLAQDERDLAWDEIQTAVRLDPNRLDALRQLYFLFRETDRKDEGMEFLDQLALDNPSGFAPLLVKGQVLAEEGNWLEAQEALQEALLRDPDNEETLLFYSAELGKRGQRRELIQFLEPKTETMPLSLTINLAMAYSRNGQMEKASKLLKNFLQRPGLSPLDKGRAKNLLRELGDHP